jgi:hypothetical protein
MEYVALVTVGGASLYYGFNQLSEFIVEKTQPLRDFLNKQDEDAIQRQLEEQRQQQIINQKNQNDKYDHIRLQYNLNKKDRYFIINDTKWECIIIYVNHHLGPDDKTALKWAKNVIENMSLDLNLLNMKKTVQKLLKPNEQINFIQKEFNLYTIIAYCEKQYKIIKELKTIQLNDLFFKLNQNEDDDCYWHLPSIKRW